MTLRTSLRSQSTRVEILNGVERRRRWSDDEKARITEETFAPGGKISEVARRHGVGRGLIFAWRRQARASILVVEDAFASTPT